MVTSVTLRNVTWMDGVQVAAQDLRLQSTAAHLTAASPSGSTGIAARPGVRYAPGNPLLVSASSGMNISVAAGFVYVQGTASATAGMYEGCLDTTSTLTVTTSDPMNPRVDNVIVKFVDNGNNTSTGTVEITAGTPAASPVAPALPANSLLLATIAVGAGVSSITAGNISDARVYTVASGGILLMKDVTGGITGPPGLYVHDLSTGRTKVSDGSGNARAPKVAAFAPVASSPSFFDVTSTNYQVVTSVSVTVDGATEIEATFTWQRILQQTGSPNINDVMVVAFSTAGGGGGTYTWPGTIDGGFNIYGNGSTIWMGGMWRGWTTPSSGTVTIYVLARLGAGSGQYRFSGPGLRVQASTAQ